MQLPYRIVALARRSQPEGFLWTTAPRWTSHLLIALLLLNWALDLILFA